MTIQLTWFHAVAFWAVVFIALLDRLVQRDSSLKDGERSELRGGATIMLVTFLVGMIVGKVVP